jgi:hypothetical protein
MDGRVFAVNIEQGKLKILDRRGFDEYISTLKGEYDLIIQPLSNTRTFRQHRFLRGVVYPCFVPDHFDTVDEVHDYFSRRFLMMQDVIDLEDENLEKILEKIKNHSQKSRNSIKVVRQGDRLIIDWVKSTTVLSKKSFEEYLINITKAGADLGVTIPEPRQVIGA